MLEPSQIPFWTLQQAAALDLGGAVLVLEYCKDFDSDIAQVRGTIWGEMQKMMALSFGSFVTLLAPSGALIAIPTY